MKCSKSNRISISQPTSTTKWKITSSGSNYKSPIGVERCLPFHSFLFFFFSKKSYLNITLVGYEMNAQGLSFTFYNWRPHDFVWEFMSDEDPFWFASLIFEDIPKNIGFLKTNTNAQTNQTTLTVFQTHSETIATEETSTQGTQGTREIQGGHSFTY